MMKKLYDKLWAKITAFVLLVLFLALTIAGSVGIAWTADSNAYLDNGRQLQENFYSDLCFRDLWDAVSYLGADVGESLPEISDAQLRQMIRDFPNAFPAEAYSTAIVVTEDASGKELCRNFDPGEHSPFSDTLQATLPDGREITLTGYLQPDFTPHDFSEWALSLLVKYYRTLIPLTAVCLALTIFFLCFTLCAAGHWPGHEGIHLTWFDKIPLDLYLLGCCCFLGGIFDGASDVAMVCGSILALLLLLLLPSFAARCKAGTVFRGTVIGFVLRWLWRFAKWLWALIREIPLVWKTAVGVAAWLGVTFLCILNYYEGRILLLLLNLLVGLFLLYLALGLRKLQKGGEELAAGHYDSAVDTRGLLWDFKRHGEHLNAVQQGVQKAVAQQMKSERLKTELITNVSHDIKTPLTSIVNYVDLLKKEDIDNPTAQEYIAVLDRQSQRLRHLTEDLVEASKAATGNIPVELSATDLNVLLEQVVGEYQQRLEQSEITPMLALPETPISVVADGRLLWRVMDNLLSNVCKYAMPGTRMYLSAEKHPCLQGDSVGGKAIITVKNISRSALNISPDELTERFVRGDESRSTEGSGLGLSIASSLTTLQGGQFALAVDGDLFKATLTFDTVEN